MINRVNREHTINVALDYIISTRGNFPKSKVDYDDFSSEFHYSARYFTVIYKNGIRKCKSYCCNKKNKAISYANTAKKKGNKRGKIGVYYYEIKKIDSGRTIVVFLDCSNQIRNNNNLLTMTIIVCAPLLILIFILAFFISKRIIKPEIENTNRQNLFITNANHELKTPLAVIRANMEVEEMLNGGDEWIESTKNQVERMNGLIQNLVMISKDREKENRLDLNIINISEIINESIEPFMSLAKN